MIRLYTGRPGSGKTLQMTEMAVRLRNRYDEIVANYGIGMPPGPAPKIIRIMGADDFVRITMDALYKPDNKRRLILLDEVHSILDARDWTSVPKEALMVLAQPRKARLDFCHTAQHPSQVEKRLMIVTNYIHHCRAWGEQWNPRGDSNLLFWSSMYDSFEYQAKGARAEKLGGRFFSLKRAKKYGAYYDTMEVLERMSFDKPDEDGPKGRTRKVAA